MSLTEWIIGHGVMGLFWLWVLIWGGAEWLEGWKSFFIIDWFAAWWSAEQLRLYALCILVFQVIWFFIGFAVPEWRGFP